MQGRHGKLTLLRSRFFLLTLLVPLRQDILSNTNAAAVVKLTLERGIHTTSYSLVIEIQKVIEELYTRESFLASKREQQKKSHLQLLERSSFPSYISSKS